MLGNFDTRRLSIFGNFNFAVRVGPKTERNTQDKPHGVINTIPLLIIRVRLAGHLFKNDLLLVLELHFFTRKQVAYAKETTSKLLVI